MARSEKFKPFEPRLWRYELPAGWVVLAGKTDQDNDHLSIKMAKANDFWFHVKGMPGSHVVLQVPAGEIRTMVPSRRRRRWRLTTVKNVNRTRWLSAVPALSLCLNPVAQNPEPYLSEKKKF